MQTCTLNGTWQLSAGHRSLESVDMQIPGTVLSGLLAAGKIKDPFYRTNEDATRALFWKDYVFTRTFDVDEELLAQQHIVLVCEGLDTLAEISINGTFLAKTDNMHRTWKFQAKKLLHPGKNEIQIVFRSVLRFIEDYPYEAHKKNQLYSVRLHERKPAFAQSTLHVWLGLGSTDHRCRNFPGHLFTGIFPCQNRRHPHPSAACQKRFRPDIHNTFRIRSGTKTLRGTLRRRCRQTAADETV